MNSLREAIMAMDFTKVGTNINHFRVFCNLYLLQIFYCDICQIFGEETEGETLRHLVLFHSVTRDIYTCICGQRFPGPYSYMLHVGAAHISFMYSCNLCGYRCESTANIQQHLNNH